MNLSWSFAPSALFFQLFGKTVVGNKCNSLFTSLMPLMSLNQQCQNTEGTEKAQEQLNQSPVTCGMAL